MKITLTTQQQNELLNALVNLAASVDFALHLDWDYTYGVLGQNEFIDKTFFDRFYAGELADWEGGKELFDSYHAAVTFLINIGIVSPPSVFLARNGGELEGTERVDIEVVK